MNIAFCILDYFPHGGLQKKFIRFANACIDRGHDMTFIASTWSGEKPAPAKLTLLPTQSLTNHARYDAFASALQDTLNEENYDVVFGANKLPGLDVYYAGDVCYKSAAFKNKSWLYRQTPRYRVYEKLERAVFDPKHATHILTIPQQLNEFQHHYKTPRSRFTLLPPEVLHPERITACPRGATREKMRAEIKADCNDQIVLFVSSAFKTKGLWRAIQAFAALPSAIKQQSHLVVIGKEKPGIYRAFAKYKGLQSRVHFLGARNDVAEWLTGADVLIHPAIFDCGGNVIIESLLAQLPLIVTDTCGYATHVHDSKAGVVIPSPFKQTELNTALQHLLTCPPKTYEVYRTHALAYRSALTGQNMIETVCRLIETVGH